MTGLNYVEISTFYVDYRMIWNIQSGGTIKVRVS